MLFTQIFVNVYQYHQLSACATCRRMIAWNYTGSKRAGIPKKSCSHECMQAAQCFYMVVTFW